MADQQPIFDTVISGNGTVNSDIWVNLCAVPTGKAILLGYSTYISEDKNILVETRSNLSTKSAGTLVDTVLHDDTGVTTGACVDRDFYQFGYVNTLTAVGTGVERLWLHIRSQNAAAGAFDYIIRYTTQ